jgi:hypothetical protein
MAADVAEVLTWQKFVDVLEAAVGFTKVLMWHIAADVAKN